VKLPIIRTPNRHLGNASTDTNEWETHNSETENARVKPLIPPDANNFQKPEGESMKNLKKKFAFLLALVMVLSMVPAMNVAGANLATRDAAPVWTGPGLYRTIVRVPARLFDSLVGADTILFDLATNNSDSVIQGGNATNVEVSTGVFADLSPTVLHIPLAGTSPTSFSAFTNTAQNVIGSSTTPLTEAISGEVIIEFWTDLYHYNHTFSAYLQGVWGDTLGPRIQLISGANNNIVHNPGQQVGVAITTSVRNFAQQTGAQPLNPIVFTERALGQAFPHANNFIWLQAPVGYNWVVGSDFAVEGRGRVDTVAVVGETTPTNPTDLATRSTLAIELGAIATHSDSRQFIPGGVAVSGLYLQPRANFVVFAQDLNINAQLRPSAGAQTGTTPQHWRNESLTVARQQIIGVGATREGDIVDIRTGQTAGTWAAPIILVEDGINSFLPQVSISATVNNPGVFITDAEVRVFNEGGSRGDWVSMSQFISFDRTRVDFHRERGTQVQRRVIELRLRLASEPNHVGHDVESEVSVNVSGVVSTRAELNVARDVVVARLFDPITLSAETPTQIPFGIHAIGVALNAQLADVTLEETAVGRLAQGQFIDVYLIPTYRGVPLNLGVQLGGAAFNTTRGLLTCQNNSGLRLRATATTPEVPGVAIGNGIRFVVEQASNNGAGAVNFTGNSLMGAIWNLPGIAFEMVFGGTAVTNFPLDDVPMPYSIVVGELYDQAPPVGGDDTREPGVGPEPGPGPGPGPGNGFVPVRDYAFNIAFGTRDAAGIPAIITNNGVTMIQLRHFLTALANYNLRPHTPVVSEGRVDSFTGFNAAGSQVTVTVDRNVQPNVQTLLVGGSPIGDPGNFGMLNLENRWYMPLTAIQTLFGFELVPTNGGFNVYR